MKPGRCISTICGPTKMIYSRVMYAFEVVLKRQPWYAFSRTPAEIAERVAEVCSKADNVTNSDFSKFDGHGSNVMRELEKMALLRAFRPSEHSIVIETHNKQFGLMATATFGTCYETKFSRLSGSPETSIFNSLVNSFVGFFAWTRTMEGGAYVDAVEAFKRLGIYGGDDGLTGDIVPKVYVGAAKAIGQELAVEPVTRGKPGVKFLARIYSPDVWYGCTDSVCDLPRQMAKFHVTVNLGVGITPLMKLKEKARSFVLSDANTPVIGDLSKLVLGLNGGPVACDPRLRELQKWYGEYDAESQYPNVYGPWMLEYLEAVLPGYDYKAFQKWCANVTTMEQCLSAPMCIEIPAIPETKEPVLVNGILYPLGSRMPPPLPVRDPRNGWRSVVPRGVASISTSAPRPVFAMGAGAPRPPHLVESKSVEFPPSLQAIVEAAGGVKNVPSAIEAVATTLPAVVPAGIEQKYVDHSEHLRVLVPHVDEPKESCLTMALRHVPSLVALEEHIKLNNMKSAMQRAREVKEGDDDYEADPRERKSVKFVKGTKRAPSPDVGGRLKKERAVKPPPVPELKTKFDRFKAKKIQQGTWVEPRVGVHIGGRIADREQRVEVLRGPEEKKAEKIYRIMQNAPSVSRPVDSRLPKAQRDGAWQKPASFVKALAKEKGQVPKTRSERKDPNNPLDVEPFVRESIDASAKFIKTAVRDFSRHTPRRVDVILDVD
nr:RNA-dependent RNA polymerase [Flumine noda-like virus 41]